MLRIHIIKRLEETKMIDVNEMYIKLEFIGVRGDLLTKLPLLITLKSRPPPGLQFQKPIPNIIKEPIFAQESLVFYFY